MKKGYSVIILIILCVIVFISVESNATDLDMIRNQDFHPVVIAEDILIRSAGTVVESEPNNIPNTADQTGNDFDNYGTISNADDMDWWVVSFGETGYANFWLGNIPSGCNYDLSLYASNGTTLLAASLKTGNANELISEYWVTANTNYYVLVNSHGGYSSYYYKFRAKNYPYHEYAGFIKSGSNRGVSATITMPSSLPNVSDSGESAWVSTSADSHDEWVQTGVCYYAGCAVNSYTEHFEDNEYIKVLSGIHALGASIPYKVELSLSDGKWHAYINGQDKVSAFLATQDNPVQVNAEIHKKLIQMGPFSFSNVKIKSSLNVWTNNTVYPSATSPYSAVGSPTSFTVYGP